MLGCHFTFPRALSPDAERSHLTWNLGNPMAELKARDKVAALQHFSLGKSGDAGIEEVADGQDDSLGRIRSPCSRLENLLVLRVGQEP